MPQDITSDKNIICLRKNEKKIMLIRHSILSAVDSVVRTLQQIHYFRTEKLSVNKK